MLIIGITGTNGAGKGTIVDFLVKNKKFKHYSVGKFLSDELHKKNKIVNRPNLQAIANKIREKYGPDYITQKLFEKAKVSTKNAIIESIRNPNEAIFIKSNGGIMFAVDAAQKTRYERIRKRLSNKDSVTFKEFQKQEASEMKSNDVNSQNLSKCIKLSDYKFKNNGTINELERNVGDVLKKIISVKTPTTKYKPVDNHVRPTWDEYFLEIMHSAAKRATCDRGRTACVFVKDKQIIVTGYVGSPAGFPHCDEVGHLLKKTVHEDGTITEHCVRTVHAEQNAIVQAARRGVSIDGSTVYMKLAPCRTCAMLLINSGVKRIVAEYKYQAGTESEQMIKKSGIKLEFKNNQIATYK